MLYLDLPRVCFFCRLAKQHKFQSFAVKNAVSFQKCRFDVFTEVAKLAVGKSRRLVGESRRLVGKSRRFKTLTYHRKHVNAKSASVQNSWRLLEKTVLIEKAEKMHTCEDPGMKKGTQLKLSMHVLYTSTIIGVVDFTGECR